MYLKKILNLFFTILVIACSSSLYYDNQIISNTPYLNSTPLVKLHVPDGMVLPIQNEYYNFLIVNKIRRVGKTLDIRPPTPSFYLLSKVKSINKAKNNKKNDFIKNKY